MLNYIPPFDHFRNPKKWHWSSSWPINYKSNVGSAWLNGALLDDTKSIVWSSQDQNIENMAQSINHRNGKILTSGLTIQNRGQLATSWGGLQTMLWLSFKQQQIIAVVNTIFIIIVTITTIVAIIKSDNVMIKFETTTVSVDLTSKQSDIIVKSIHI